MKRLLKKGVSVLAMVTMAGSMAVPISVAPVAAEEALYRNVALRRAAYHSSAANYNDTGHLVTDGIIVGEGGAVAEVSTQYNDSPQGEDIACAFDGDTGTKWLTFHTAAWLQVIPPAELAAPVKSYTITSANDAPDRDPKAWTLQGSDNGTTWTTLDTRSNQSFAERFTTNTYTLTSAVSYARYRLNITANNGDSGNRLQLSEWNLLGADGKSVLRKEGPQPLYSVWTSKTAANEWVYIDLGAVSEIDKVKLYWLNKNYATSYEVQTSADAKAWTAAASVTNGAAGERELSFAQVAARYVRVLCKTSSGSCFALSEVEVWGKNDLTYTLPAQPEPGQDERLLLTGGNWRVQRASEVEATAAELTTAGYDASSWLPAVVPGTVLTSYLRAGAIPDPDIGDQQLQISDSFFTADFWYRNTFAIPAEQQGKRTWLNFDAINWKADVYLNGESIGKIEGGFIRGRFDITDVANYGGNNELAVYIHKNDTPGGVTEQTKASAGPNGGALGADNPTIHASVGWDWVPTIRGRNIGIYEDVFVEFGEGTIEDPWVTVALSGDNNSKADLAIHAVLNNTSNEPKTVKVWYEGAAGISENSGKGIEKRNISFDLAANERREVVIDTITVDNPRLWWPNGYGEQVLHGLWLGTEGGDATRRYIQFGIREFTYNTDNNVLKIYCNGVRITSMGGNWGMDDSNLAATPDDYDVKVRLHAEAGLTMIRNWVGMTNHKAFYDACDKYGVLIWDDFWLANPGDGPVPKDEAMFIKNARDKVSRNRYHAALALYCGRNEGDPPATLNAALAELTQTLDGTRLYIPHSASGTVSGFGPYHAQDPKWYFGNAPVTLHSERGMPNIPAYESMLKMLTEEHAWPMDNVWGLHDFCGTSAQGADDWETKLKTRYGSYDSLAEFVRLSQLVNYENHKALFESVFNRRGNGMLMWMSQSAWPSMVWQTYDYYYDTNAGYFGLKKGNQRVNAVFNYNTGYVQLINNTAKELAGYTVRVKAYNLAGEEVFSRDEVMSVEADQSRSVLSLNSAVPSGSELLFITTEVFGRDGHLVSDNFYWHNFKTYGANQGLLTLPAATLTTSYKQLADIGGNKQYAVVLENKGAAPILQARVLTLDSATGEQMLPVYYSDNYVSLMPGETKVITLEIDARYNTGTPKLAVEAFNAARADITAVAATLPDVPHITPPEPDYLLGDVNADDAVDSTDARLVLQHEVRLIELDETQQLAGDVNHDDRVDSTDARMILQHEVRLINLHEEDES